MERLDYMEKTNRIYYLLATSIIVIAILPACRTSNSTSYITRTPTEKVTYTPSKQITKTPELSETMEPTLAYWATAQEERFDSDNTRIAETKQAIFSLATNYPQLCGFQVEGVSISPDGNWIATDCRFDGDYFRVYQAHGNKIWDIPYSAIFEYYPEFLGSVRILHWSVDGNYLYFANSSCCADIDAWTNGDALYRLNLQDGEWILLIPGSFNYYSFSPNGQLLIYLLNNQAGVNRPIQLHLFNMVTGEEELIDTSNFEMAAIDWKQDGQKIALIAQTGNIYDDNRRFSLVVVDLQNKKSQVVILNTENGLSVKSWSNDDILAINRSSAVDYNGYYINTFDSIQFDLKNNQFTTPISVP